MSVALHLYQQLRDAPDDNSRAKAIADAFEQVEEGYPNLKEVATQGQLRETELRLVQEIEQVRMEIREVDANLRKDIEQVRLEIRQVDAHLRKDIEQVRMEIREVDAGLRKEIEQVRLEIRQIDANLRKDIEQVRLEIRQADANLRKDIEQVRLEIKEVEVKLLQSEVRLTQAIHRQTYWIIGSVGTIIGFIRLLDWLLANLPK